jgi:hypothetical protein
MAISNKIDLIYLAGLGEELTSAILRVAVVGSSETSAPLCQVV